MRRLKRSVNRYQNRWLPKAAGITMAAALAVGTGAGQVQQVYAAGTDASVEAIDSKGSKEQKKKEVAIYLDLEKGNDKADGSTAKKAVCTWKMAKKLAVKTGANVIYISGTLKIEKSQEWVMKDFVIKRAKGFEGSVLELGKEVVLTVYGQEFNASDVKLGEKAQLKSQKDIPEEVLQKLKEAEEKAKKEAEAKNIQESQKEEIPSSEPEAEEPAAQPEAEVQQPVVQPEPEPEVQPPVVQPEPEVQKPDVQPEAEVQQPAVEPEDVQQSETPQEGAGAAEENTGSEPTDGAQSEQETPDAPATELSYLEQAEAASDAISAALAEEDVYVLVDITKEYEALAEEVRSLIPADVVEALNVAQENAGMALRTCDGITVTGEFLPWYVQFKAQMREDVDWSSDLRTLLSSYEFELWNLMTDTAYAIPEGYKVTVTMKVPEHGLLNQLVIVHTLEDGTKEYITPVIDGEWLHFETSSFSPFDVAGNNVIVGVVFPTGNNAGSNTNTQTDNRTDNDNNTTNNTNSNTNNNTNSASNSFTGDRVNAPQTGDMNAVLPYALAAASSMLAAHSVRRKKEDKE